METKQNKISLPKRIEMVLEQNLKLKQGCETTV